MWRWKLWNDDLVVTLKTSELSQHHQNFINMNYLRNLNKIPRVIFKIVVTLPEREEDDRLDGEELQDRVERLKQVPMKQKFDRLLD